MCYFSGFASLLKESLIKTGGRNCVRIFHQVNDHNYLSMGYSIAAIFEEYTDDYNKPKIIGLNQSLLRRRARISRPFVCARSSVG